LTDIDKFKVHEQGRFSIIFGGKEIGIDISDAGHEIPENYGGIKTWFQYHNIGSYGFPLPPISFYDWNEYDLLCSQVRYDPKPNKLVTNRQRAYGNALSRRRNVHELLASHSQDGSPPAYGDLNIRCDYSLPQLKFWQEVNDTLVAVCVPGQRPDILDRGQLQLMALGCCTISPLLIHKLPYNRHYSSFMVGDKCYRRCHETYGDLLETIEWCKNNIELITEVGQNAQMTFQQHCTPAPVVAYMREVLGV
jgi:hypothetical protein